MQNEKNVQHNCEVLYIINSHFTEMEAMSILPMFKENFRPLERIALFSSQREHMQEFRWGDTTPIFPTYTSCVYKGEDHYFTSVDFWMCCGDHTILHCPQIRRKLPLKPEATRYSFVFSFQTYEDTRYRRSLRDSQR